MAEETDGAGERLRPRSPEVSIDRIGRRLVVIFW
jgi:hypothetical protein